jgi:cytochrome d ubiquinol oxidase subunit II
MQLIWFLLVGLLFAIFFFLEGFDFGVGMSITTLARDEREVNQAVATIGPVWDANEVWLISAGGVMFAAMPFWYASVFSGYYMIMLLILVGLILRGVSFEFQAIHPTEEGHEFWGKITSFGSFIVPFMFGLLFTSMIQTQPVDKFGNINLQFADVINPLSIVGGIAVTGLCYVHGLNYLKLKTEGDLRERAAAQLSKMYLVVYVVEVLFAILIFVQTNFFTNHPVGTVVTLALIVLFTGLGHVLNGKHEVGSFLTSGLSMVAVVGLIFQGLFPYVVLADKPANSIKIADATSSAYTLQTMTIVLVSILPFVLAYTIWSYYIFRKRIKNHPK